MVEENEEGMEIPEVIQPILDRFQDVVPDEIPSTLPHIRNI